jgi:hypothetical protein
MAGTFETKPDPDSAPPSIAAIYVYTAQDTIVSTSGAIAHPEATDLDIYAEISGLPGTIGSVLTGIALANRSEEEAAVEFRLLKLDGSPAGLEGTLTLAPGGQIHSSILELADTQNLSFPFHGTLHLSSSTPIAALAVRGRYNERGDFLLSTTPPTDPALAPDGEVFIPQVLHGGGYNTQIVIFGGTEQEPTSGNIYFFDQNGQPITPPIE